MSGQTFTMHVAPHGGRSCGSCTLCCKLVPVSSLNKRAGERCKHQSAASGCKIYARRPLDCAAWSCQWLANPAAAALLGADTKSLVGRALDEVIELVDETDRKLLKDPIELALHGTTTMGSGRRALLRCGMELTELGLRLLRDRGRAQPPTGRLRQGRRKGGVKLA